ncbi:MAG: divalent metal cation transporter [Parcubacteria group bacterium]|jgi:Mn2+/Fe2+ NRAMP family transporter
MENKKEKLYTIGEFHEEVGVPLIIAKKLIIWGEVGAIKAIDGTLRIAESEVLKAKEIIRHPYKRARIFLRALGPGLITGASDDDPSGIGTYSSVGAKFGFAIIWMAAWLLPIMLAVQEACARIGVVTNKGLAGVIRRHYSQKTVITIVGLLIIANVVNIGADLGAMAASLSMLTKINFYAGLILFAFFIILVEIFVQYHLYVKVLKWLALSLFAYVITGIIIHPSWTLIWKDIITPQIQFNKEYIFAVVAVFGTSITPYLFFWQASEEVEEGKLIKATLRNRLMHGRIRRMRTDVKTGMIFANVAFFFIVLTTAQVLFKNGITDIGSAEQAALALEPFAGNAAYLLFALGIIGTGLLAVPILAGSGAYALSEVMKWHKGLELKFSKAKGFYLVIAFSILFGLAISCLGINPIKALYYSAFINGVIAVPLLITIMIVGNDKKIMGEETNPHWVSFFGWLGVLAMIVALILMIVFSFM